MGHKAQQRVIYHSGSQVERILRDMVVHPLGHLFNVIRE